MGQTLLWGVCAACEWAHVVSMKKQDGASASPCLMFFTVYQWGVFLERMRHAVLKCVFCFVSISESVDRSNEWVL